MPSAPPDGAAHRRKRVWHRACVADLHAPHIGHRTVQPVGAEIGDAFGVDRKILPPRCSACRRVAAVHRDLVGAAIFMPVVMLQPQARACAGYDPGAAAVGADMEGDFDAVARRSCAHA